MTTPFPRPAPRRAAHSPAAPGTVLRTDAEVLGHLVGLVGPEARCDGALWLSFLTPSRQVLPLALPLEDLPAVPDRTSVATVLRLTHEVVSEEFPGAQVVAAVVRGEGGDYGAFERGWAHALWSAADSAGVVLLAVASVGEHRARMLARASCVPALGRPPGAQGDGTACGT